LHPASYKFFSLASKSSNAVSIDSLTLQLSYTMVRQIAAIALLATSFALSAQGAALERPLEQRDNILSDITSGFGDATSAVGSVFGDGTSDVASVFGKATSIADNVFETVTSDAGSIFTIVTSEGGEAITLAGSAGGRATSFAGHQFTVATSAFASATSAVSNGAVGRSSFSLAPVVASFVAVTGGALVVIL